MVLTVEYNLIFLKNPTNKKSFSLLDDKYVTETNKVYSVSPSIIWKYKLSVNDDLLCVCSDKDVYSSNSVQSNILTVDHSKNFPCNLRYDNLFFEDLCFNESKERLSNTSGQTPTDNLLHHIVLQSNGNILHLMMI